MLILELHKMSLFRNIHLKLLCYQMTYSTDLIYQYVEKDIYYILFLLTENVKNKSETSELNLLSSTIAAVYRFCRLQSLYLYSLCLRVLTDIKHACTTLYAGLHGRELVTHP